MALVTKSLISVLRWCSLPLHQTIVPESMHIRMIQYIICPGDVLLKLDAICYICMYVCIEWNSSRMGAWHKIHSYFHTSTIGLCQLTPSSIRIKQYHLAVSNECIKTISKSSIPIFVLIHLLSTFFHWDILVSKWFKVLL